MEKFSVFSITLMTFGMLLFGLNRIIDSYSEPIILLGYISFNWSGSEYYSDC